MADDLRERLLASYAETGEAMVVQNVLETEGIPCRVADLAQLPRHVFGMAGALGRSVGVWVLEVDAERAKELLATLGTAEAGVDEEALVAEALAAASSSPEEEPARAGPPARARPLTAGSAASPWLSRAVGIGFAVLAIVLISRGCR